MNSEQFYSKGNLKKSLFLANSLFVDEIYESALENYNKAIELNQSNAEFYEKRAACHIKLENYKQAIEDSEKSLKLNSEQVMSYLRKG